MRSARLVRLASDALAFVDRHILMALVTIMLGFVTANVATRAAGVTIAWANELAVYAMIMTGFVGASLMLRLRMDPAVTLAQEFLPERIGRVLRVVVAVIALAFGLFLMWTCWRWFDPPNLIRAGFDIGRFQATTFNFIYTEVTPVLNWPKAWFFLVVPWFALTASVHAATNLLEEAGFLERPAPAADAAIGEG